MKAASLKSVSNRIDWLRPGEGQQPGRSVFLNKERERLTVADTHCPRCGSHIHRSRTRGLTERLIKALTSFRTFRCKDCGWRGWSRASDSLKRRRIRQTVIGVAITLLVTTLLALYLVHNLNPGD